MKASKKAQSGFLFLSGSTYQRIPVFRYRKACEIFLKTLEAYRHKYRFRVHAYALLPDHYHLLLWLPPDRHLVNFLRDFKSLVGKRVLEWMREERLDSLREHLRLAREARRERDARYCVLQYNSYVKALVDGRMVRQKINYIHANPVRAGLVETPEAYPYSSARTYVAKGLSLIKVERLELPYE